MDKKYDHLASQKEAQSLWEKEKTYAFESSSSKETFSIDTPPPTVSGSLHIGHIFSYTHTDIIARYKRMQGFNVFYPMGFDDNGLPTERFVEKKNKTKAHLMKRSEFISLCLKESALIEKEFESLWKEMGLSIDWAKTYSTISDKSRRTSQLSFIDLYQKGLIERKEEASLYCTTCNTSVAQAELDSMEMATTFNDIVFETESGEKLTIATTRPELLPACVAVFFHPDDKRYKHLENQNAITPIFNKKVKIIADNSVEIDKGSGLVMCCTFGDQADILWQKKYKLPFMQVVGYDGKWVNSGPLDGLKVHEARKKVLEILKEENKLLDQKKISHAINIHERCKQGIEYLILKQWFVKILEHKETFLKLGEKINWYPQFMHSRFRDWVENLGWDWCISRQRYHGIPVPVWHCECSKVILADQSELPVDPQESVKVCSCGKTAKPDTDVMDTWATSALTPQLNIGWPDNQIEKLPMSMRPQAHDIIRTWALYTIIKSHYHNETIPWRDIVISGHVLVGKAKISKSSGGAKLTPEALMKNYPVDAIRYWSAQGRLGVDTAFSENQLKIAQRLLTKLWNAMRFCSEHIKEFKQTNVEHDDLTKWLLHEFSDVTSRYKSYFDKYEYTNAIEVVEKFFWHNFCDNYLELIKDQIFKPEKYSAKTIESTRFALHEVSFGLLQLFAPILPHITETLYQSLFRDGVTSIHKTTLKNYDYSFPDSAELMNHIVNITSTVRKLKTSKQLSLKVEIETLTIHSENKETLEKIKSQENVITGVAKANKIEYQLGKHENEIQQANELWVMDIQV